MDLPSLQRFMCELGVDRNPSNFSALIRFVQKIERSHECFGSPGGPCHRLDCAWAAVCPRQEVVPEWKTSAASWPRRSWSSPPGSGKEGFDV